MGHSTVCPGTPRSKRKKTGDPPQVCPDAPRRLKRRKQGVLRQTGALYQMSLFWNFLIQCGVSPHVLTNVVYVFLVETRFGLCVKYGVATTLEPRVGLFGKTPGRLATLQQKLNIEECSIISILAVIPEDVAKGVIKTQLEGHILKETEVYKVVLGNHKEFREPESLEIFDRIVKILTDKGVPVYQNPFIFYKL